MIDRLPPSARKYGESPEFNERTVPKKLTSVHRTKPGVWGRLCMLEGSLRYIVGENELYSTVLAEGEFDIIQPEVPHRVEVIDKARFKIEFYK